jgi:hypothetical protein
MLSRTRTAFLLLLLAFPFVVLSGCGSSQQKLKFESEYQAVFLANGQVFFGKITDAGAEYPLLKDVFYVQTATSPETKQPVSILVKRGNEWHGPDLMYINSRQIVVIEPVAAGSRVAALIAEAKKQKPEEKK